MVLRIRLPDPRMSSDHGRLRRAGDHWLLDDPQSKNGAVVAGRPTRCAPVHAGELFELGQTMFRVDAEDAEDAEPLARSRSTSGWCAATHRDLEALVAAGRFRQDLYARLLGVTVALPPLRDRRGDLGLLIGRLLARVPGGADAVLTPAAAFALLSHDWPLNVRELERTLLLHGKSGSRYIADRGLVPRASS